MKKAAKQEDAFCGASLTEGEVKRWRKVLLSRWRAKEAVALGKVLWEPVKKWLEEAEKKGGMEKGVMEVRVSWPDGVGVFPLEVLGVKEKRAFAYSIGARTGWRGRLAEHRGVGLWHTTSGIGRRDKPLCGPVVRQAMKKEQVLEARKEQSVISEGERGVLGGSLSGFSPVRAKGWLKKAWVRGWSFRKTCAQAKDGKEWQNCAKREMEKTGGIPLHIGMLSHGVWARKREKEWPLCVQSEVGWVSEAQMVIQGKRGRGWDSQRKCVVRETAGVGMRGWKASDAFGLPWQGSYWWLGACESGRGQSEGGEGENSMARSLLVAGSRGVQMTLWKVDQGGTERWLASVAQSLHKGQSAAFALKQAQQQLRKYPEFAHPFYWSGFVLLVP